MLNRRFEDFVRNRLGKWLDEFPKTRLRDEMNRVSFLFFWVGGYSYILETNSVVDAKSFQ
jgi:hypothetical protein